MPHFEAGLRRAEGFREPNEAERDQSYIESLERDLVPDYASLREAIRPADFAGSPGYSLAEVREDEAKAARIIGEHREKKLSADQRASEGRGDAAEASAFFSLKAILNPAVEISPSSHVDDVLNNVDITAIWKEGEEVIPLAIDVTEDPTEALRKMDRHLAEIDRGRSTEIKYPQMRGKSGAVIRRKIPVAAWVVLPLTRNKMVEVSKMNGRAKNREEFSSHLTRHSFPYLLMYQMRVQLEGFRRYAERRNKREIASAYAQVLRKVDEFLRERLKEDARKRIEGVLPKDPEYKAILDSEDMNRES